MEQFQIATCSAPTTTSTGEQVTITQSLPTVQVSGAHVPTQTQLCEQNVHQVLQAGQGGQILQANTSQIMVQAVPQGHAGQQIQQIQVIPMGQLTGQQSQQPQPGQILQISDGQMLIYQPVTVDNNFVQGGQNIGMIQIPTASFTGTARLYFNVQEPKRFKQSNEMQSFSQPQACPTGNTFSVEKISNGPDCRSNSAPNIASTGPIISPNYLPHPTNLNRSKDVATQTLTDVATQTSTDVATQTENSLRQHKGGICNENVSNTSKSNVTNLDQQNETDDDFTIFTNSDYFNDTDTNETCTLVSAEVMLRTRWTEMGLPAGSCTVRDKNFAFRFFKNLKNPISKDYDDISTHYLKVSVEIVDDGDNLNFNNGRELMLGNRFVKYQKDLTMPKSMILEMILYAACKV